MEGATKPLNRSGSLPELVIKGNKAGEAQRKRLKTPMSVTCRGNLWKKKKSETSGASSGGFANKKARESFYGGKKNRKKHE